MIKRKELYNIFGWHTNRHLVVISSDDWGSIRMPSRNAYEQFLRQGIRVDLDPFCRYDGLETKHDLENLFEVLYSVKDKYGHPAVVTANTLSANPVFEKIREADFEQYFYEPFTETLNRDAAHEGAWEMWQQGIASGVFRPQCHGREHLYVKKWLRALQSGHSSTCIAFAMGTWGLTDYVDPSLHKYYMGAYDSGNKEDIRQFGSIILEGLDMFERLWGFRSLSFTPTTYTWSPRLESYMVQGGIHYLDSAIHQHIPIDDDHWVWSLYNGFQGTKSNTGLIHLFRNCFYEPSTSTGFDFYPDCLHRIELAFKWGKAANICAHRLNFIGSIDSANTDRNLPEFKHLLQEIVRRWPDVEFVSSDQLGHIIDQA